MLAAGKVVFVLLNSLFVAIAGVYASRRLHSRMLRNILRSPMSFFDTTPLGRVLNRFSKDIFVIDELLPRVFSNFLGTLFVVLSTIIVIMIVTPTFAIVILPLGIFYFLVQVNCALDAAMFVLNPYMFVSLSLSFSLSLFSLSLSLSLSLFFLSQCTQNSASMWLHPVS